MKAKKNCPFCGGTGLAYFTEDHPIPQFKIRDSIPNLNITVHCTFNGDRQKLARQFEQLHGRIKPPGGNPS